MLYLDSATTTHGVTLFRDYNDSNRFYYLPLYPKLTREAGDPLFQLLIYRRDITDNPAFKEGDRLGGGFLTMTVDLSIPESTLQAIKDELGSQTGQPVTLTPVLTIRVRCGSPRLAQPLEQRRMPPSPVVARALWRTSWVRRNPASMAITAPFFPWN